MINQLASLKKPQADNRVISLQLSHQNNLIIYLLFNRLFSLVTNRRILQLHSQLNNLPCDHHKFLHNFQRYNPVQYLLHNLGFALLSHQPGNLRTNQSCVHQCNHFNAQLNNQSFTLHFNRIICLQGHPQQCHQHNLDLFHPNNLIYIQLVNHYAFPHASQQDNQSAALPTNRL